MRCVKGCAFWCVCGVVVCVYVRVRPALQIAQGGKPKVFARGIYMETTMFIRLSYRSIVLHYPEGNPTNYPWNSRLSHMDGMPTPYTIVVCACKTGVLPLHELPLQTYNYDRQLNACYYYYPPSPNCAVFLTTHMYYYYSNRRQRRGFPCGGHCQISSSAEAAASHDTHRLTHPPRDLPTHRDSPHTGPGNTYCVCRVALCRYDAESRVSGMKQTCCVCALLPSLLIIVSFGRSLHTRTHTHTPTHTHPHVHSHTYTMLRMVMRRSALKRAVRHRDVKWYVWCKSTCAVLSSASIPLYLSPPSDTHTHTHANTHTGRRSSESCPRKRARTNTTSCVC